MYVTMQHMEMQDSPKKESEEYMASNAAEIKENTMNWFQDFVESCSDEMQGLKMAA